MQIKEAEFVISNTDYRKCPKTDVPEFAFIGRSNVGKSSLINMLCGNKALAKTSSQPGKTQCINLFSINKNTMYWVDLPGYGYARTSKESREKWRKMTYDYLEYRENLACVFVLVDGRHEPQKSDVAFINWLGEHGVPLAIVATKADKTSQNEVQHNLALLKRVLSATWESLPPIFMTSALNATGKAELLDYMADTLKSLQEA
ncbi:MAG: ribosome biogenesis GTP-binding protein YihA/YsxC [Bacteroidales bacterium]|nr:ribosome biogenesis GTP-binding protein YihA/YsxC [Bacteroidales bacterium]MDE6440263.1 ribosome biogenesis GTP-binding protein YihA/YsxC [Bacteroidales bacterium]